MTKFQNLFVALLNMDIFQMTPKLSLFTTDFFSNFCWNIVNRFLCMQIYADVWTVSISIKLSLSFR